MENKVSVEASCKHYVIKRRYYTCWKMQLNLLHDGVVSNVQKFHSGQSGSLLPITNELLQHVFELHEQGIDVMYHIVCGKASDLCHDFWVQSERAKANVIFRWLKSHALKYHMDTHETQRSVDLTTDVMDFMQHICPKVSEENWNPKYIIMDQTPIFFNCHWNGKGTKSVNICTSTNDAKRATLAVSMCTDGKNAFNAHLQKFSIQL